MSLEIAIEEVEGILLPDGWHKVLFNDGVSSFDIDAYEYISGEQTLLKGGSVEGVPSTGAAWLELIDDADGVMSIAPDGAFENERFFQSEKIYFYFFNRFAGQRSVNRGQCGILVFCVFVHGRTGRRESADNLSRAHYVNEHIPEGAPA